MQAADDLTGTRRPQRLNRLRKLSDQLIRQTWIVKIGCANLDRRRTRYQKFHHIIQRLYATYADDWYLHSTANLPHNAKCQWLDCWPAEPPRIFPSTGRRRRQSIAMP